VDHSKIDYIPIRKNFFVEVPEIAKMTEEEVEDLRKELDDIKVRGKNCPRPIKSFVQAGLTNRFFIIHTILDHETYSVILTNDLCLNIES